MIFVDTADFNEARKWIAQLGIAKGITTNQKIFLQTAEGVDYRQRIKELLSFKVPTSIELTKTEGSNEELIWEALEYVELDENAKVPEESNVVIKVPMWGDGRGLEVAKPLINEGVKVNMTCMMNFEQAILACELGVTYASLFYNRIVDYNHQILKLGKIDAQQYTHEVFSRLRRFIDKQSLKTKIIAGSIRYPFDVADVLDNGAHIATVTPQVLEKLPYHSKTEETIAEFDRAWKEFTKRNEG